MPESIVSQVNEISLREHLEAQIEGVRRELLLIQSSQREGVLKAEDAMSKRLDAMNEFRHQLREQASGLATRDMLDKFSKDLSDRIERQERDFRAAMSRVAAETGERITRLENKNSNLDGRFWAIGAVVVLVNLSIAILSFIWKP